MSIFRSRRVRTGFAAALLAGTMLGGLALDLRAPAHAETALADTALAKTGLIVPSVAAPAVALPGFADLVARVRPAVVTIVTTEAPKRANLNSPFPPGSPQDRMFRRQFGNGSAQSRPMHALGSGFVIDGSGHIVTNNHVVDDATSVLVKLEDGRELQAAIIGRDPRTDLALLKVEAGKALPYLALGDSDKARPGDWVVAVGNPFGLDGTVTTGVVSARGRDIGQGPYDDFLQIDASINSGNSGGPLFALDGSVIGVNTAIFSPSGGSVGIGFAIPSNLVREVVGQIQANGKVERGFLGASTQTLTPALAKAMKLDASTGALVAQVEPESPAAKAGLKAGDVVTAVGAARIGSPRDLARAIGEAKPGSQVALTVSREGRTEELRVTLAELRDREVADAQNGATAERGQVGIALAPLDDAARAELKLPKGAHGAVVAQVRPDSPAAEAGLQEGDVLTAVGGQEVRDPAQGVKAIRDQLKAEGGSVALRILRDGRTAFVAIEVPKAG